MADQTERVEYEFTGDVSSLESATKEAISLLNQYESVIKDLTASGNFNVSKTAFGEFNKAINSITRQVNSLVGSLNKSSKEMQTALVPDTDVIRDFSQDLNAVLEKLQTSTGMTSKDVKLLTEYLRQAQSSMTGVVDKAKILSSSFINIKSLNLPKFESESLSRATQQTKELATATENAASQVKSSIQTMSSEYNSLIQNASFRKYAQEVTESYGRINKSAKESASVFFSNSDIKFEEKLERIRAKSEEVATNMKNALGKLSSVFNPFKTSIDNTVSKIQSFKDKASTALEHVKLMLEAVTSGFRIFGNTEDKAAAGGNKIVASISKIQPKIVIAIKAFQKFQKVLNNLRPVINKVKSAFNKFVSSIKNIGPQINSVTRGLQGILPFMGGFSFGDILGQSFEKATSYIENLNLFTVAMGDAVEEANVFVDTMSELYGMDPSNLYRYAGYFYQLSDAIGATSNASKNISLSLTKAANDIGSLFNVDIETVVNNLASGMQGMSMAVRKYGIDIRQATLQQTALNYGFTENVAKTSEANRQALRFLTMMDQVRNATKQVTGQVNGTNTVMGDFARNIETPANQLRIFKEQMSELARSIGNFFIPVFQKCLYVINGVVMAIKTLLQFLASLIGIDIGGFGGEISSGAKDATDAVGGIGDAASSAAKDLKKLIAPFDELTILTEPKDTGGGGGGGGLGTDMLDPSLEAAIEAMSLGLDEIRMKALDVRDKILELLGLHWEDGELTVTIGGFIDDLMHLWDSADYTGFGQRVAIFLNQGIAWGVEHTDPAKYTETLNSKIKMIAQILNGLVAGLNWEGLGTIIGNGITIALNGINTFLEEFNWNVLGAQLARGLNGIIESVDWPLLGETLGNLFMAKVQELQGFFDIFEWSTLGTSLGDALLSLLDTIKWDEVGKMLSSGINGVMDSILAFFEKYEWGTIGDSLVEGLNTSIKTLKWANVGKTISNTMRALLREAINFLGKLDWVALGAGIGEMLANIDWLGLFTDVLLLAFNILQGVVKSLFGIIAGIAIDIGDKFIEGFQDGIVAGLVNIGQWLYSHLVQPIVDAVKSLFGIHSPSTVAKEIGGYFVEGFKQGILEPIKSIGGWLKTSFGDPIINGIKSIFGITGSDSTVFKGFGKNLVDGMYNGVQDTSKISNTFSALAHNIETTMNGLSESLSKTFKTATNNISTSLDMVKNSFNNMPKTINIPTVNTPNIYSINAREPKMATGGVVTGPTHALIGEGRYDEAVIPLGNSPQIEELIGKIATAVSATPRSGNDAERPIEVHVYLEGEEITSYQNRANRMYGKTQLNV